MSQKGGVSNQRNQERTPIGVTLDIQMRGAPDSRVRGTITDISGGGMTFKSDAELEEGMTLHLSTKSLQIRGEVRSVRGPVGGMRRYGVRFHKIAFNTPNPILLQPQQS